MSDIDVSKLACYGCAHSAAGDPYPGRPSGERPCCFCVRNPQPATLFRWYNGRSAMRLGALGIPGKQDNYIPMDRVDEERRWIAESYDEGFVNGAGREPIPRSIVPSGKQQEG